MHCTDDYVYNRHMPRAHVPAARIDFRPKPDQKKLFERAAALEGQTLTEFLIRSAEERARRVIQEHETLELRGQASARFIGLLFESAGAQRAPA